MSKRLPPKGLEAPVELEELRRSIDSIDRSILELLNQRAQIVKQVGEAKRRTSKPIYHAGRERDLVAALRSENPGPFPDEGIAPVFREIISATRSLEGPLRVAYLGPEGTYSHLAARKQFGSCGEFLSMLSISEIFRAVETGAAEFGIIPIENTTEGAVTSSLDAMVDAKVTLCAEVLVPISHQLLSRSGKLEDIQSVVSHPQPLAQCRGWLDRHLPGIPRVATASTVTAAKRAVEDPSLAAIGSALAGELNGLAVVAADIEDDRDNTTRFVVIGREGPGPSGHDLTSAVYTIRRDQSGALYRLLEPFSRHGITLTALQCRPIQGHHWEYHFFLDLEGHASQPDVAKALTEAASCADSYRVLGSFPRAGEVEKREGGSAS
jgi:chorismate mutase / prephenate dehydratase